MNRHLVAWFSGQLLFVLGALLLAGSSSGRDSQDSVAVVFTGSSGATNPVTLAVYVTNVISLIGIGIGIELFKTDSDPDSDPENSPVVTGYSIRHCRRPG